MQKTNFKRFKSAVLSGLFAVSALVSPMTVAPVANPVMETSAASVTNDNYAKLLQYSLYFYDANMCGSEVGSKSQLDWRGNCHTNDEVDGGFHDAGDHAMFGLPQGYSASTLGWSYYEFKSAYDALGQTSHYKTIANHFAEFFKDCTKLSGDTVSSICIQKGIGQTDHDYWGSPEKQGDRGGCDWRSSGCGDIAAEYAASLALNYLNFGNTEDLKYAKALYKYAKSNASVSTGDCTGFYKSDSVNDDIAWAAGWLYLATNEESYKTDCANNQVQYLGWTHSWNNVDLGSACVYAHITGDWSKVNSYLSGQCTSADSYYFLDKWGSARLNTAMQLCALSATKNSNADYSDWAAGQMDYILGDNPANTCFVIGYANNSAKNPHHRAASGYSSYEDMGQGTTIISPTNGHSLVGALVGGPSDANGTYVDSMADYICNEVAVDYNAGLVGAAAGLYEIYKTGSLDSSIEGVGSVSTSTEPVTTTTTTTTKPNTQTTATTTKVPSSTSSGLYSIKPNQSIDYNALPEDDKMFGWEWSEFGIPAGEKVNKVEVRISASKNIGKWQGAFGSSTTVSPEYWTQSSEMEQTISGNSGSITWDVDSATANIIQYNYGGELKFGVWWIDCGQFTIDEVNVYTDSYTGTTVTTASTTQATANTTQTTATTNSNNSSSNGCYEIKPNQSIDYNALPEDDKMFGWEWSEFGIPASEKVKKVEINISASGNIGKWQGAFGSSTTVSPEYWTQSADMEQTISGNSGSITWNVDSATADIIQYNYGGELKFGVWWIDCGQFTIDSVKVYTDGSTSTTATTSTTTVTTVTTTVASNDVSLWGDANCDGKVAVADAVAVSAYVSNSTKNSLSTKGKANSDVHMTGNGLNATDALTIQQYATGIITKIPV